MEVEAFLNEHPPAGNQKDLIVREQKILGFWIENLANNRNTTQQRWEAFEPFNIQSTGLATIPAVSKNNLPTR